MPIDARGSLGGAQRQTSLGMCGRCGSGWPANCLAQARIQETLRTLAQERRPVNEGCQQSSLTQEANKRQCAGGWGRRSPGVVGA
jgi:hypothetical protein